MRADGSGAAGKVKEIKRKTTRTRGGREGRVRSTRPKK